MRTSLENMMIGEPFAGVASRLGQACAKPIMQASLYSSLVIGSDWQKGLKNLVEKSNFASSLVVRWDRVSANLALMEEMLGK